ncbi:MAG: M23 family metallopeptidase [Acidimicrobiales bacterium]
MTIKPTRTLFSLVTAVALTVMGTSLAAGAEVPLPPGITLPPRASDTTTTTVAAAPPATLPSTTAPAPPPTEPPVTEPPATTPPPPPPPPTAPPGETKIIKVEPSTKILDAPPTGPAATGSTKPGDPASSSSSSPSAQAGAPQASSLTPGQVDDVLRNLQRTGASSTSALVEALKPLQNLGMTLDEALTLGMGQFPLLGVANWTDDWLDHRNGPPPHPHQGNDLFAAFDTPVRAPVDGIVRFEDAGLGGKGAFVTAPDGTYYYMAHLNAFARDLLSGSAVKQGQIVGYNGDSGNAKGGAPHVHFEIHPRGGAAVNPKPILDAWVADAMAKVPELLASFQPKPPEGSVDTGDGGVPQILVATGMTRRFSAPSLPAPGRGRPSPDFKRAVLGPLTPPVLAPILEG